MEDMPPGFRFYPTEEELVSFYLHNKLEGRRQDLNRVMERVIPVVDIYESNPCDLPQLSGDLCHGDPEQWFFFIPRQESEARGGRPKRLTTTGYWKATGSPNYVYSSNNRVLGLKRTMVFYNGRAPNGKKTEWKINEYKAVEGEASSSSTTASPMWRQEFSLCRLYKKSKCLRAFDRRPSGVVIAGSGGKVAQQGHNHGDHEATTSSQHHLINNSSSSMMIERTSSPESSSSGDPGNNPSQTGEGGNIGVAVDSNDPWWDLEQLNWLNGME